MTVGNWPTGCFAIAEIWELPQKDLSVQREKNNRLGLRDGTQKLSADLMNDIFLIGIVLPEGCWHIGTFQCVSHCFATVLGSRKMWKT